MGKTAPVQVLLLVLIVTTASGLTIEENPKKSIHVKLGSKAILPCLFKSTPAETAPLEVTWLIPGLTSGTVLTYVNGKQIPGVISSLFGRVSLPEIDLLNAGNASLLLQNVQPGDSKEYMCLVRRIPATVHTTVQLEVQVPPGKVSCGPQGTVANGHDVVLTCKSMDGSNPFQYTWSSDTMPTLARQDMISGTLTLRNVSLSPGGGKDGGKYVCAVKNDVGTATCSVVLALPPAKKNTAGVIAGAVIGVLLAVLLITCLVTWILRRQKQSKVPEQIYEVRMDESPPLSRPGSRAKSGLSVTSAAQTSVGSATPSNGRLGLANLKSLHDELLPGGSLGQRSHTQGSEGTGSQVRGYLV
uniref:coxsackievirus and adenovirus receptor homolog isoform X1 n=1 Tax=Myxine glutinosa TaxID=7769 RepID=UPI00358E6530